MEREAKLEPQSYETLTNAIFQGFTTNERGSRSVSNDQPKCLFFVGILLRINYVVSENPDYGDPSCWASIMLFP